MSRAKLPQSLIDEAKLSPELVKVLDESPWNRERVDEAMAATTR